MTPAEYLKAVRAKIDMPEKWTQGYSARDADGALCLPTEQGATCFCILGAFWALRSTELPWDYYGPPGEREAKDCIQSVLHERYNTDHIPSFNDDKDRTHAQVLEVIDEAIKLAEAA